MGIIEEVTPSYMSRVNEHVRIHAQRLLLYVIMIFPRLADLTNLKSIEINREKVFSETKGNAKFWAAAWTGQKMWSFKPRWKHSIK